MAAKMAVYYTKYKKIFPEANLHAKCWLYWFWSYRHLSDAADASLRIWYIQDGVQAGSW